MKEPLDRAATTKASSAAAKAAKAAKVGAAATKSAAAKAVSAKGFAASSAIAVFAGRRALWPGLVFGGVCTSAAWFGVFEIVWSASKFVLPKPPPEEKNANAELAGCATIPVVGGGVCWLGKMTSPPLAAAPSSVVDLAGMLGFLRSLPCADSPMNMRANGTPNETLSPSFPSPYTAQAEALCAHDCVLGGGGGVVLPRGTVEGGLLKTNR